MPRALPPGHRDLETTFTVRVFNVRKKERKRGFVYEVRWSVAGRPKARTFATRALADNFRSTLMVAIRQGESFDLATGQPLSMLPSTATTTWWEWMLTYVDLKWPTLAPSSRRSMAEALFAATLLMLASDRGRPSRPEFRAALNGWALNAPRRAAGPPPAEAVATVKWLEKNTILLTVLDDPRRARAVLDGLARKQDGTLAAATTIARKRALLHNALELAVERELLVANPLSRIRWKTPKATNAIDPRSVINPEQARALLDAVAAQPRGRRLVAFFGAMYYSALRPSEALALHRDDLVLPTDGDGGDGWGQILVSRSNPDVSGSWDDTGRRTARQLKHRARGEVRRVPAPPQLVELLRAHLAEFCQGDSPRVFRGVQNADLNAATYNKIWKAARRTALSPAEAATPLAARPYDLRHAAVSTWLSAGVDSTQVAAWAGHSVLVLHRVYAHVLSGNEAAARLRIDVRLKRPTPEVSA